MESENIYGVDPTKEVTPAIVRDAIITCFVSAHKESLGVGEIDDETAKGMVTITIKKFFGEIGADFNNPTKEDISKLAVHLKEFSKDFRNQEVIKNHFQKIQELIAKIGE